MAGPLGMIFMGHRCTEKGHDPVAGELVNGAFKLMDLIHQNFKTVIHDQVNFFGFQLFGDGGVAGHIGKKHRYQFAFAFNGASGSEDLIGQEFGV